MIQRASKKVEGGKLVRVKILADEYINDIQISGDFFLHPEDVISHIEQNLKNLHRATPPEEITYRIENVLAKHKGVFVGLLPEDLTETIIGALNARE